MFCTSCGNNLIKGAMFCIGCGTKTQIKQEDTVTQLESTPEPTYTPKSTLTIEQNNFVAQPVGTKTNGMAIGAFIVSFFLPVLGFILGFVSLSKIRKTGENGRRLSIASIVLSTVFAVINIILIVVLVNLGLRDLSFQGNVMQWYDTYTFENGDVYDGDFVDGNMHGHGTLTYPNGDVYVGDFVDGDMHGHGTATYANGDVWFGYWEYGKRVR